MKHRPQSLPCLSRSRINTTTVKVARVSSYEDWVTMKDGETLTMTAEDLPGVVVTMPEEDFNTMLDILHAHHHAQSTNPAVNDAWLKYRMLMAMTR